MTSSPSLAVDSAKAVQSGSMNPERPDAAFLDGDNDPPPRRCMVPFPRLPKASKFELLPAFGGKADFIDIDGHQSIEALSADWSKALVGKDGKLCDPAPVVFDVGNAGGVTRWGSAANGAIVVAKRGVTSFSDMARNAEASGAVALIVVDNEPRFRNNWNMTTESGQAPSLPAVMVPQKHAEFFCGGCNSKKVAISRRPSGLSKQEIAWNFMASAIPFS